MTNNLQYLQEALDEIETSLKETGLEVGKIQVERESSVLRWEAVKERLANAQRLKVNNQKKFQKAQASLLIARVAYDTAAQAAVDAEAEIERLDAECDLRLPRTKVEAEHDKLEARLKYVAEQLEKLKKKYYKKWETWSPTELVKRFESGDMVYTPFTDGNDIYTQELLDAYKSVSVHEGPSEMEIFAVSMQIIQSNCTSPWGCKFWDSKKAAFPNPFGISLEMEGSLIKATKSGEEKETEHSVNVKAIANITVMIETPEEALKPQFCIKTEAEVESTIQTLLPDIAEPEVMIKEEDITSVLGKTYHVADTGDVTPTLPETPSWISSSSVISNNSYDAFNFPSPKPEPVVAEFDSGKGDLTFVNEKGENTDEHFDNKARLDSPEVIRPLLFDDLPKVPDRLHSPIEDSEDGMSSWDGVDDSNDEMEEN